MLDAGCGTGLCGPALRPLSARLVGVDLSSKMLERARGPAAFDAVVCADTLCYFGALEPILAALAGSLRPGGRLAFTVERGDSGETFALGPQGRYRHSRSYVEAAVTKAGLTGGSVEESFLRREGDATVYGLWVAAAKP